MLPRKATFALKSLVTHYKKEVLVKKENFYEIHIKRYLYMTEALLMFNLGFWVKLQYIFHLL